jgi:hypothetical protein
MSKRMGGAIGKVVGGHPGGEGGGRLQTWPEDGCGFVVCFCARVLLREGQGATGECD